MQDYIIKNWTKGTVNRVEDETLPKGAASDSLNWLTKGDHIELRRGTREAAELGDANEILQLLQVHAELNTYGVIMLLCYSC